MITALVFLFVGGAFVGTLLKGLFTLLTTDAKDGFNKNTIFRVLRIPIICFAILMLYLIFVKPYLVSNGYEY